MLKDTLFSLLSVYGPSGREEAVAARICELLAPVNVTVRRDAMGNLIMEKKGAEDGKIIMFSAHMDHIGLVVTDVEKEGYLRVARVGGIGADFNTARHVVFGNGVQGVVIAQPVKEGKPQINDLFVDIGAQDRREALQMISLGDVCVYAPHIAQLGAHRVSAPAMDDRCACALLVELLLRADNPRNTIVAVFSTQEEVGVRGAEVAAYSVQPDIGIGLDVTAWGDTPETRIPSVRLGDGVAIKFMDSMMISSPVIRDALIHCARENHIPYQCEVLPFGGTDGAAIQHSRAGVPTCTLSIPCRYVHSACETIDMRDMSSALDLMLAFVDQEL